MSDDVEGNPRSGLMLSGYGYLGFVGGGLFSDPWSLIVKITKQQKEMD